MFALAYFVNVSSLFSIPFWMPLGLLWRPFGAFVVSLACWCHPVRFLWLAWAVCVLFCYFFWCLWLVWAVCGVSMLLLGQLRGNFACSFYVLPSIGEFRWCWGCGLKVLVRRSEISNALPVPMLRQVFARGQNRAPMQVKLIFSQNYSFLGFQERRFTCMGAHFPTRIGLPCR